jgi:UDP-3-O-[3-hydroxymyristoyl] glucosamine N-acyltransferase
MPEFTSADLASRLQLTLHGDQTKPITGVAALDTATPTDLAFVGGPKYFAAAATSNAGCLIAPPGLAVQPGANCVIESPNPRADFARALNLFFPPTTTPGIHPTAAVDPSALIHPSASIGPHCTIGPHTTIGPDTILHANVTVYDRAAIGTRCIIHSGAVIGADGFGFEFANGAFQKVPQVGTVEIGNDVEIGANTCIDRAALGVTRIGDGAKLDNLVHIAHNCQIGKHVVIAAQTGLAGGVTVGDYAIVGGQVGVGDKARIESRAVIGSGAGILSSKIVRAGEPVWGTPARPLRRYLAQLATLARLSKRK